jgi:hypothetical protein
MLNMLTRQQQQQQQGGAGHQQGQQQQQPSALQQLQQQQQQHQQQMFMQQALGLLRGSRQDLSTLVSRLSGYLVGMPAPRPCAVSLQQHWLVSLQQEC